MSGKKSKAGQNWLRALNAMDRTSDFVGYDDWLLYLDSDKRLSPEKAINAKCCQCRCDWDVDPEITECNNPICPLHPYYPYHKSIKHTKYQRIYMMDCLIFLAIIALNVDREKEKEKEQNKNKPDKKKPKKEKAG